jgi:hypothetical protein
MTDEKKEETVPATKSTEINSKPIPGSKDPLQKPAQEAKPVKA